MFWLMASLGVAVWLGAGPAGSADDDGWCGNGEGPVICDEAAKGNPVPGTEVHRCVED